MRVLVTGGRNYSDRERVFAVLDTLHADAGIDVVIHGAYRGADTLADQWAEANGVPREPYEADWENQGSFAGPARNTRMVNKSRADVVIAFHGDRGTADCVRKARKAGIDVVEIAP